MDPVAVLACDDTLGTQNHTVRGCLVECLESCLDAVLCELLGCLEADGIEDFICVMVMMILTAVAYAVLVIAVAVILVVMIMLVMVVIVVMFVLVIMIVMVLMLVVMVVLIVMMVVMLMLFSLGKSCSHIGSSERILDSTQDLSACELLPRCCDYL